MGNNVSAKTLQTLDCVAVEPAGPSRRTHPAVPLSAILPMYPAMVLLNGGWPGRSHTNIPDGCTEASLEDTPKACLQTSSERIPFYLRANSLHFPPLYATSREPWRVGSALGPTSRGLKGTRQSAP